MLVCIDYRKLNDVTIKDAFPIPKIDQSFDALKEAKVFSSMSLSSGYWQIHLALEHCHETAFVTPDGGLYEYVRIPFGLSNAPGTFQRLMNEVYKFILFFLDDVLAYSSNRVDHLEHLRTIFQTLQALNLKLKPTKCKLFQREVVYLSHIFGNGGAKPEPDKIRGKALARTKEGETDSVFRWLLQLLSTLCERFLHRLQGHSKISQRKMLASSGIPTANYHLIDLESTLLPSQ